MATIQTPVWTSGVLTAPQCLARGNQLRTTLDLRGRYGARVFFNLGRGGTAGPTTPGVSFSCRAMPGDGTVSRIVVPFGKTNTINPTGGAILKLINNVGGYVAGTSAFVFDGVGTPVIGEYWCFWGVDALPANGTALTKMEFIRCTNWVAGTNTFTADAPCLFARVDNEICTSLAEAGMFDLPSGHEYEFVWDYLAPVAGDSLAISAWYSTYDDRSAV